MIKCKTMYDVAVRIFPNNSYVRDKIIYVNIDKVKDMPVIAETLDVQDCEFWFMNKTTTFKGSLLLKIKMFFNFKILRKSHFIMDR